MSQDDEKREFQSTADASPELPAPKLDRHPKPETLPTTRHFPWLAGVNLATLLASLALLGYLIYHQNQSSSGEKTEAKSDKSAAKSDKSDKSDDMKSEVDRLKDSVRNLSQSVEHRPPTPDVTPMIKSMDDKFADLGKTVRDLTGRLDTLDRKSDSTSKGDVKHQSSQVEAIEKRVGDLAQALEAVKLDLASRSAAAPSPPVAAPANDMDEAIALFKQGKYAEAKDAFARLRAIDPDDARAWYFSALANGLATRDWKGESERLVNVGLTREKAGTPDRAKIDAAFSALATATGKEWLSFYRNQAAK